MSARAPIDRERLAATVLRELDVARAAMRLELASLDRARAVLLRDAAGTRCDAHSDGSECFGPVWARWCRQCGEVVRRCDAHGGLVAAVHALDVHRAELHGAPMPAASIAADGRLSIDEFAGLAEVSSEWLRDMLRSGGVRGVRADRRWRIAPSELEAVRTLYAAREFAEPPRSRFFGNPRAGTAGTAGIGAERMHDEGEPQPLPDDAGPAGPADDDGGGGGGTAG